MKLPAKIQKWGNGLALRVAGAMREIPDFKEGTPVEIEVSKDGFSVTKVATTRANASLKQGFYLPLHKHP